MPDAVDDRKSRECREKAGKIRYLALDVDGVLTDGRIILDGCDGEWKAFDVKDGHRLALAGREGIKVVFITGRDSDVVNRRAKELSVYRVFQGTRDKGEVLTGFLADEGATADEVAYLGDDLVDLPAMKLAGLSGAVKDAVPEVLEAADWVSHFPGGRGAAREMVELILRSQGKWDGAVGRYRK